MKKILLLTIPLVAFAAGCQRSVEVGRGEISGNTGALTATFRIPDARQTRAYTSIDDETIESLWVMVFNEAGNYVSRHRGVPHTGGNYSVCTFSGVPVSGIDDPQHSLRILHFVANYDWTGFSDAGWIGRSESEVLVGMSVGTDGQGDPAPVAFWQRVEVPSIFINVNDDPDPKMRLDETVHLLRNVARITVENLTEEGEHSLSEVSFAVANRYDRGTVAPYNTVTYKFGVGNDPADGTANDDDFVTEAAGRAIPIAENDDFVEAEGGSIDLYERRNSTAEEHSFVIVRGKFDDAEAWSYYKIDIAAADADVLPDIRRNWRYNLKIMSVSDEGYATLAEAVANLASNNVNASVVASEYTDISNGNSVLHIEKTHVTLVSPGEPFTVRYSFTTNGAEDNDDMEVTLVQDANGDAVAPGSVTATGGVITGTSASTLPTDDIYRATITVSKNGLSRTIQVQLRQKMNFTVTSITPENVPDRTGEEASITFTFPNDISPRLFPLKVRIYTRKFTPAPGQGLSIEFPKDGGDYYYVYNAPYLGLGADERPVPHTIRLVSNSADTTETVTLAADLFNDNTEADFL